MIYPLGEPIIITTNYPLKHSRYFCVQNNIIYLVNNHNRIEIHELY
jgi:hypothetical protein